MYSNKAISTNSHRRSNVHSNRRNYDPSGALNDAPGSSSSSVRFSLVEIREFERVVGDNPSCSSGVPVSIGWNHGRTFKMNLEDFERARPPRRAQMDLVLSRGERHRLLVEWGASGQDVIEAIRMIIRVKNQRRQTVNNLGSYDRIEEVFENMLRNMRRLICQSSSNSAARRLQEESERAATIKKMQKVSQASLAATESLTASPAPPPSASSELPKITSASISTTRLIAADDTPELQPKRRDIDNTCGEDSILSECSVSETLDVSLRGARKSLPVDKSPNGVESEQGHDFSGNAHIEEEDEIPEESQVDHEDDCDRIDVEGIQDTVIAEEARLAGSRMNYDDFDDVSNPQSHDHKKEQPKNLRYSSVSMSGNTIET